MKHKDICFDSITVTSLGTRKVRLYIESVLHLVLFTFPKLTWQSTVIKFFVYTKISKGIVHYSP